MIDISLILAFILICIIIITIRIYQSEDPRKKEFEEELEKLRGEESD